MLNYFSVNQANGPNQKGLHNQTPKEDIDGVCRICLGEEDEPDVNPLFSPCMCAGSMELSHL